MFNRFACVFVACCLPVWGQGPIETRSSLFANKAEEFSPSLLRVDTSTVMVPVYATTKSGSPATSLKREDFELLDNGAQQQISYFTKDDVPVSIGILFDASGSMKTKMPKAREAVKKFLAMANSKDEFFVVAFSERPKLVLPLTDDAEQVDAVVSGIRAVGRTSLYDAVALGLREMKHAKYGRRALVVFSDGGDNRSRFTFKKIKNALLESDVQMYAIGIYPSEEEEPVKTQEENKGPELLQDLTAITGGKHFPVNQIGELPEVSEKVSIELRSQYILGFSPTSAERDGRFHRVDIRVPKEDQLTLQYRRGYRTPIE